MISSEKALKIIISTTKSLGVKKINISEALGYVLAQDLTSQINVPPFDNSAMDGFAVCKNDYVIDKPLKIVNEMVAGKEELPKVKEGEAIPIMTGASVPGAVFAVVPIENTVVSEGKVKIEKLAEKGANIRRAGEDIKKGALLVKKGTLLKPIHIALAASIGQTTVKVYKKPKVSLVVTGDEIIKPGCTLKPGQIYDSNSFLIKSLLKKLGLNLAYEKKTHDSMQDTVKAFLEAFNRADVLLTTGGISVGKYDFVARALKKIGAKCHFNSVSQKPGKPLSFFTLKDKAALALPGNPVAVALCFELYVRPLLLKKSGNHDYRHKKITARFAVSYKKKKGRKNWLRVNFEKKNGSLLIIPTGAQGSGILTSMVSDGVALLEENKEEFKPGDLVKVLDFKGAYK